MSLSLNNVTDLDQICGDMTLLVNLEKSSPSSTQLVARRTIGGVSVTIVLQFGQHLVGRRRRQVAVHIIKEEVDNVPRGERIFYAQGLTKEQTTGQPVRDSVVTA